VDISDGVGGTKAAITAIEAGAIIGKSKTDKAEIILKGTTGSTSGLSVSGAVTNVDVNTGQGQGLFAAKTYTNGVLSIGVGKDQEQAVTIGGAVKDLTMNMSAGLNTVGIMGAANNLTYVGGAKDDKLTIAGALSNSAINLGAAAAGGANELAVAKAGKGQTISNTKIDASGKTEVTGGAFKTGTADHYIKLVGNIDNTITLASIAGKAGDLININLGSTDAAANLTVSGAVKNLRPALSWPQPVQRPLCR
jgi:hypothetical protein